MMMQISFYDSFKYHLASAYDSVKTSLPRSTPLISSLGSLVSIINHLIPEYLYDDPDFNDPKGTFIVSEHDQIAKIAAFYIEHGTKIKEGTVGKVDLENRLTKLVIDRLSLYKQIIDDFNADFGTSVNLCVSLLENDDYAQYSALGGTKSFTNPLIHYKLPPVITMIREEGSHVEIDTPELISECNQNLDMQDEHFNLEEKKFIFAHEFRHILNNDSLVSTAWRTATTLISCAPWIMDFNNSSSWVSYICSSAAKSLLIESTSKFFYRVNARNYEKRADIEAMNYLKTNKGAEKFFSKFVEAPNDYFHPSQEERLKYISDWKPVDKQSA